MADTTGDISAYTTRMEKRQNTEWKWQLGLRVSLLVLLLVDLALVAYCVSVSVKEFGGVGEYDNLWWIGTEVYLFIPIGLSLIWTLIYLPLSWFRKHRLHPGFAVGFDLFLWLAIFAVAILYLVVGSYDLYYGPDQYGYNGQGSPSASTANNYSRGLPYTYESNDGSTSVRQPGSADYDCPYYNSCADQYGSADTVDRATAVSLAADSILLVCGLLHFVLWVWACVDCARWNRRHDSKEDYMRARLIAEEMVRDMRERGEVVMVQQPHARAEPPVLPATATVSNTERGILDGEASSSSAQATALPPMQEVPQGKGKSPLQG